jgi:RuvB-like protein 1 (pontin 52)
MSQIIKIRAATENLSITTEAVQIVCEIGSKTTLRLVFRTNNEKLKNSFLTIIIYSRFAIQLLAPAAISAKINGRTSISPDDIKDIGELFLDAKSSAKMLEENSEKYMM